MLRDFEDEIVRLTGATRLILPSREFPGFIDRRIAQGTRYSGLRKFIPKADYEIKAEILWVILMNPDNFSLDLFKNWDRHVGFKILYLIDTWEKHVPSIRRVLKSTKWDVTITAHGGAKRFLEEETQRSWRVVPLGVKLERFQPATREERQIGFCAYGRRLEQVHRSVKEYCSQTGKDYDYTIAAALQPQIDPSESYQIYAWHLTHSVFNFCWPMEVTNPGRVRSFSPITCRFFESAASGTVVLGEKPDDPSFDALFGTHFVISIDHTRDNEQLMSLWDEHWGHRKQYLQAASERIAQFAQNWSWESRVREILKNLK